MLQTCFFVGHHTAPESIQPQLEMAVERHITQYHVAEFIVGRYGNFDRMAAHAVIEAKKRYPTVTLTLLLPYYPFGCAEETPADFERTFYPPGLELVPKHAAIPRANQYMIKHCNYLIAYHCGPVGNTGKLMDIAKKLENKGLIHIENLAQTI